MDKQKVWIEIPRTRATKEGCEIITARCIEINKGDTEQPDLRSQLAGKEFSTGNVEGLFAATSPLAAL